MFLAQLLVEFNAGLFCPFWGTVWQRTSWFSVTLLGRRRCTGAAPACRCASLCSHELSWPVPRIWEPITRRLTQAMLLIPVDTTIGRLVFATWGCYCSFALSNLPVCVVQGCLHLLIQSKHKSCSLILYLTVYLDERHIDIVQEGSTDWVHGAGSEVYTQGFCKALQLSVIFLW